MNGQDSTPDIAQLLRTVEGLRSSVDKLTHESEIKKLHHKYGYYLDKCLYQEVAELFSNHPETYVQFLNGRFNGKQSIERLYVGRFAKHFVAGRNGPIEGWLLDHLMAQDIVDFEPGSNRAKARFRTLMSAGTHESMSQDYPGGHRQWWEGGVYENEYIRENGVWKIFRLRYWPFWHGAFSKGWQHCNNFIPLYKETYPALEWGPDEILEDERLWPDTRVVPFHYAHPVTGKEVTESSLKAPKWRGDEAEALPARKITDWDM
ncbi:hypothetical protein PENARI_c029G01926 [Penicillium arizonense]|uniref:SnoaL-like domain-containing protein n=1 Tax=Penicillium arizonense TaxID=1835702 RepID=A0A1F5L5S6_PENAI|nr:hypothetical protein PENARI_c029G01926 [Penicillium arizonense]OGE48340.1 hypothetical protein PENARI_c029G01926 [Penicillium arizonense]